MIPERIFESFTIELVISGTKEDLAALKKLPCPLELEKATLSVKFNIDFSSLWTWTKIL